MKQRYVMPAALSFMVIAGCQATGVEQPNAPQSPSTVEGVPSDSISSQQTTYSSILFGEIGTTVAYDGMAEYGYLLTLEQIDEAEHSKVAYVYKGVMNDGLGDEDGTRNFRLTYTVTGDEVVETITNHDPHRRWEDSRLLNSIIPSKVVLKGELKTGTTWDERFEYQGQSHTALNELTVQLTEEGKTQYRVETIVEDIQGFVNQTYTETRVFEEGLGLVSFSNTQPLDFFDEEYQAEYSEAEFYQFGYGRSGEISDHE